MAIRFALLGALCVRQDDGSQVTLRAPMERALLATLLLRPREVVTNAYLLDLLWQGFPPANAQASLHNHIRRLRRALGSQASRIQTRQPGYLFDVQDDEVDIRIFEDLVRCGRARARAREWAEAAAMMDDALALWRGEPLADITANTLTEQEVPRLHEMRVDALQWRFEAELAVGGHEEIVPDLQRLILAHPLRERLHGQLMLAYYRSGRQAEALAAFREARRTFVTDLGIEPSAELRRLHRQILAGDVAEAGERPLPAQLPPDLSSFSGRGEELARLDAATRKHGRPCVLVISGPGGIGKTSLAVHWAHRVCGQFVDGQLYIDLRGFSRSAVAVSSAEALRGFLAALGIPADRTPTELAELSGLFRSVVASKRILVFLDNARDADQVRPLLAGTGGCLTIVTSRNPLAGMVVGDNAHSVALDVLAHKASLELLASRVGEGRLADEPEAAARIVDRCAGLPLALALAAARVLTLPHGGLAGLAAELSTADGGLAALAVDDSAMDVRSVLASSYRLLSTPAQRLFRSSGVLPGSRISVAAMASVAGQSVPDTRRPLAEIAGVGLVTQQSANVYAIHDLIRSYAAALIESDPREHQEATSRMFAYYIHSAFSAAVVMAPQRIRQDISGPPTGVIAFEPATVDDAGGWFADEYINLLAVAEVMRALEADQELSDVVWALSVYCHRVGLWDDEVALQVGAVAARDRLGDVKGVADARRSAGQALVQLRRLEEAEEQLRRGLDAYLALAHLDDASGGLLDLAWVCLQRDHVKTALEHAEHALAIATATRPYALNTVGLCHLRLGDHLRALSTCEEALALHERAADLRGQAETWDSIAVVYHRLGRFPEAMTAFDQAVSLYRANWDRHGEAEALEHQAEAAAAAGSPQQAAELWRHSLRIYESLYHPDSERVARKLEEAQALVQPPNA
jgi:DNA-binding SARP family transcriptional activator